MKLGTRFIVALALVAFTGVLVWTAGEVRRDREWRHVARVLLEGELEPRPAIVARWKGPVTVGVSGGRDEDRKLIAALLADLNILLAGSGVTLKLGKFKGALINVMIVPFDMMDDIARKMNPDAKLVRNLAGRAWVEHLNTDGQRGRLDWGFALVADELEGWSRRRILTEELVQTLVPLTDSHYMPQSVFYETSSDFGWAETLAPIDRKLIRFLYLHLKSGDGPEAVRRAFDAHWHGMSVPPPAKPGR